MRDKPTVEITTREIAPYKSRAINHLQKEGEVIICGRGRLINFAVDVLESVKSSVKGIEYQVEVSTAKIDVTNENEVRAISTIEIYLHKGENGAPYFNTNSSGMYQTINNQSSN